MDHRFYTKDGKILENLDDLKKYLNQCSEEIFKYHQEHFKMWLVNVFKDCKNAIRIKIAKNKEDALRLLNK